MAEHITEEQMSPDASPGELSRRSGVRRVNNLPVYLVGGVMSVFLIVMVLVAADRAAQQNEPAQGAKEKGGNSSLFANEIAGKQKDGIIPAEAAKPLQVPELAGPATPLGAIPIARPENLDAPPLPPRSTGDGTLQRSPRDDELDRIRMVKMQQLEEAVKARTTVPVVAPRSAGSPPGGVTGAPGSREEAIARLAAVRQQIDAAGRDDPTAAYKARLAQLQGLSGAGGSSASSAPQLLPTAATGGKHGVAQFGNTGSGDRWRLDSQPEAPRSPYELRAGFVVAATLISGINSDLPGQIMAQIAQNVFDTATGKYLLLPQGSRLVGSYSSDVAYGQARVLVAWQRIVFPDGKAMDIGSMPGADGVGYAGFKDQVNNHYLRLFGSALLMSAVTAGISYSQQQNQTQTPYGTPSASSAMSEALGQQLGQVTAQLIAKNMNIAPTLEIRPGYRFNVIVTKDMTFSKPYQSFDY
ncbi:MAG: Type IV secretion system protein virB10 [Candidatus Accumulibacter regalis]|uniref:Type IV secretion system protein virB10 n=1 Tax=Accumulibacter regalis TaxID=522306 RepID=A0A011QZD2_ACCRE|nr:TrbI/VirB10 family protein [Accumulibacter sp.]EXI84244.1 MAG: Type IV secretion system protein virB10 [Candidatus Accumulibacter regalis]HRE71616.1 TrbI/VirB10 family protein [Accumulibacter sp.]